MNPMHIKILVSSPESQPVETFCHITAESSMKGLQSRINAVEAEWCFSLYRSFKQLCSAV